METVVKNRRLKNFLYALGYNYRKVEDKNKKQDYIYLFENTNDIQESIDFYIRIKLRQKQQKLEE